MKWRGIIYYVNYVFNGEEEATLNWISRKTNVYYTRHGKYKITIKDLKDK